MFQKSSQQKDLSSDDLKESLDRYFLGGHWGQCLELLRHLCQYSENVLLVTGPTGIGKTSLKQALIQSADPNQFKFCELSITEDIDIKATLDLICQGFGLPTLEAQQTALRLPTEDLDKSWVLCLDDADQISEDILKTCLGLVQSKENKNRIHLVLFGGSALESRLSEVEIAKVLSGRCHVVELDPLSLPETEAFLRHQWRLVGNQGPLPFTKTIIRRIYESSKGIPSEVEALVKSHLAGENVLSDGHVGWGSRFKWAICFGIVLFLLISLGTGLHRFWPIVAQSVKEPPSAIVEQTEEKIKQIQELVQQKSSVQADEDIIEAKARQKAKAEREAAEAKVREEAKAKAEREAAAVKAREEAKVKAEREAAAAKARQEAKAKAEREAAAAKARQEAKAKAEREAAAAKARAKARMAQVVKEREDRKSQPPTRNLTKLKTWSADEKYLLGISASRYTLQLIGASREAGIVAFINQHGLKGKARYFRSKLKGKPWFVVVYGNYPDRPTAVAAIAQLPKAVQTLKPWPRNYGSIQKSLRRQQ